MILVDTNVLLRLIQIGHPHLQPAPEAVAVEPGGSAAKAGVKPGDLILAAGGRILNGIDDLHRLLSNRGAARGLVLAVVRAGRELELNVDL